MLLGQPNRIESAMQASQEINQDVHKATLLLIAKLLKRLSFDSKKDQQGQLEDLVINAEKESFLRITQDGKEILLAVAQKGQELEIIHLNPDKLANVDLASHLQENQTHENLLIETDEMVLLESKEGKIQSPSLFSGLSEPQIDEMVQNLYALEAEKTFEANDSEFNPARQHQLQNASLRLLGQLESAFNTLEREFSTEPEETKVSLKLIQETKEELSAFFNGRLKDRELEEQKSAQTPHNKEDNLEIED